MLAISSAVLSAPNEISLRDIAEPTLHEGDVLIRVRAATICGTDIRIFRGRKTAGVRYPSVLGHEFAGDVIETGGHAALNVGDRVSLCPFISCGHCHLCKTGRENLCTDGTAVGYEIDGAFAEIIRIPAQAVAAGNLYTYFDIINGKNEPFVNGIMTGNADETETLFNINMGYYF